MISCTEFIPAYSELFSYLDKKYGRAEVDKFWEYLFAPTGDGVPLINFLVKEGIRGCYSYWAGTLNEEAADFTIYLNEKAGWYHSVMHHCPSKGRLLELEKELGITPYPDYCLHCDHYRSAIEKAGLKYIYNFIGTDRAACSELVYDPKIFDGRMIIDENTVIMDRRAGDNEYFHPDFHSSMNMGIHYIGENYGFEGVKEYLKQYTDNVYANLKKDIAQRGLVAIEEKIRDTYKKEKAEDLLIIEGADGSLNVTVKSCPAVLHLKKTGRSVSPWYRYTTELVMNNLASAADADFSLHYYNETDGSTSYSFKKR